MPWRSRILLFLTGLIFCLFSSQIPVKTWLLGFNHQALAQGVDTHQLMQRGLDQYHSGDFQGAIELWQQGLQADQADPGQTDEQSHAFKVDALKYIARAYQQMGRNDQAIAHLEQVITYYRQLGNQQQMGRILTETAQAYSNLGQHRRAITILCGDPTRNLDCDRESALIIAQEQADALGTAAALGSLGNAYYLQGQYERAMHLLERGLEIARQLEQPGYLIAALNNLGNVYASLAQRNYRHAQFAEQARDQQSVQRFQQAGNGYDKQSIQAFENSLSLARKQNDVSGELRTLLNLVMPYYRQRGTKAQSAIEDLFTQAKANLARLPDSRGKAYATLKLSDLIYRLGANGAALQPTYQCSTSALPKSVIALLGQAVTLAQAIQDRQAESFAWGQLGHLYECNGNYAQALRLTRQAQIAAEKQESLYLWEWQAGRILQIQGQVDDAIAAYEQSINTLKGIRGDIAIASRDLRLDFRDNVEVVYRQLADLRLARTETAKLTEATNENLWSALKTLDGLRLAELQNYLGDECEFPLIEQPVALVDDQTATINSIILEDHIVVILTLWDGDDKLKILRHQIPIERPAMIELVNTFRRQLEQRSDRENRYLETAQQLYDWFIRPFADELAAHDIKTLVFLQDGILRSIPMAPLYDGEQFLVQQYAIANTPSLSLLGPKPLDRDQLKVLAFGLTTPAVIDEDTIFAPLSAVAAEIESIKATIPSSKGLINEDFTRDRLQKELTEHQPPILHLATHAQFDFDSNGTFLVMGDNEKLTINELYNLTKQVKLAGNPIELLALTACDTAVGSDRDALGIAGIALQAGVQSAIASLWQIDDQATAEMIAQFYQFLRQGLSKTEALQATQQTWLTANPTGPYSHPGYWAAFILIGNWL
ncbi:MAG: CHAT domain-containing protein [Cyanothece sp. SIO1E1]|nr:CHAT domain-containing protein [Cyanothece sp. SIO1E1]